MKELRKISFKQIILTFFLFSLSGNPAFTNQSWFKWIFPILAVFMVHVVIKKMDDFYKKRLFIVILYMAGLFFLQNIFLGFVSISGGVNFICKIIVGCGFILLIGHNFKYAYFKTFYYLSLISIPLTLISYTGFVLPNFFTDNSYHSIGVFTQINGVEHYFSMNTRNSGMFWEPGAHAGYLLLIPLLFTGEIKRLWIFYKKECIIIIFAFILTQSTTGYIVAIFMISYYVLFINKNKLASYFLIVPLIIGLSIYAFSNFDFIGGKLSTQFESTLELDKDEFSGARMGAFIFDTHYIKKHPLVGNGMHESTRYIDHPWVATGEYGQHGNGFSSFLAVFGILTYLLYMYLMQESFKKMKYKILIILSVTLLYQGEVYWNYPLYLVLPFAFYIGNKYSFSNRMSDNKLIKNSYKTSN